MSVCAKHILSIFLILFFVGSLHAQTDNRKEKLEQLKIRLQDEIALANKILSETKKTRSTSLGQIQTVEQKLKLRQDLIRTIDRELSLLDKEIVKLNNEIDTLQKKISKQKKDYAEMIRQARKSQNKYSRLMFLLSSSDFNQAIRRLEYLKQYADFRRRQVEEIKLQQTKLNDKLAEQNRQKERKESLRKQMEAEKTTLLAEKAAQEQSIDTLKQKESDIIKELKAKQLEAKKLENEIQRIIAAEIRRAKEEAIRRRIEDEAKRVGLISGKDFTNHTNNKALQVLINKKKEELKAANKAVEKAPTTTSTSYNLTPEASKLAASFAANKSRLPWPVERGIVISKFGPQHHTVAKAVIINNNGIDIATEKGTKARAVFDGEVSSVVRIPGQGIALLVKHGNYFTIYQNLSEVFVKKGDKITNKQEIGLVFNNEAEGKTVLHFELWKEGQAVDPQPWLAGK